MGNNIQQVIVLLSLYLVPLEALSQKLSVTKTGEAYSVSVLHNNKVLVSSPEEGLWSIATGWENGWPSAWQHAKANTVQDIGEWKEITGKQE